MKKNILLFTLLLMTLLATAQEEGGAEMADALRANGKIYVVVAVILTIFAGIILYLIRLDRKITKLEKQS
ncbi:MAG: CcmD family protein [Flaviaesturariibacter sp.]|nr:CcmD family protein [Flaviaesturariibacter sp.]